MVARTPCVERVFVSPCLTHPLQVGVMDNIEHLAALWREGTNLAI